MNAEFNVWLLIVGLVVGAGLVWLVIMDSRRRDAEIDSRERPREAAWLSAVMTEDGFDVSPDAAERMLELHRAYLEAPPPDPVPPVAAADADRGGDGVEAAERGGDQVEAAARGGDGVEAAARGGDGVEAAARGGDGVEAAARGGDGVEAAEPAGRAEPIERAALADRDRPAS